MNIGLVHYYDPHTPPGRDDDMCKLIKVAAESWVLESRSLRSCF